MAQSTRLVTVTKGELSNVGMQRLKVARVPRIFDAPMSTGGNLHSDLGADLGHAIDRNELRIAYQPIISLSDTSVGGFEALVRWQHPQRGLLQPSAFIPTAETSDIIVAIDRWMIRPATLQLARWRAGGIGDHLQMSVNVSSREFSRDDFVDDLRRILKTSGLHATSLRLEITETTDMERSARAKALLAETRSLGVKLDVDDFGTGYSSLSALQHMSVDALKIERSFVASMASHNGTQLVQSIITLAHGLGLVAIAEGVETTEQLDWLAALDCDFGQGFLFAPPLDGDTAGRFPGEGRYAA
jgi:EAL domain-containing protein (putative c-di-GMP-specific phosphodiesterase class I)